MSSVFSKRGSITRVLLTTYFLKHAELIQLMGSVRRNYLEEVPHLLYHIVWGVVLNANLPEILSNMLGAKYQHMKALFQSNYYNKAIYY